MPRSSQAQVSQSTKGPRSGCCPQAAWTSKKARGSPLATPTSTGQATADTAVAASMRAALALAAQRRDPGGAVLPPADDEVHQGGGGQRRCHAAGEAERERDQADTGVVAAHQQQQGARHEDAGEGLRVGHHEHARRRVEAPERGGHEGEPFAGRLRRGVEGEAERLPHQQDRHAAEDEVQRHSSGGERKPREHERAHQQRETGVERPRAVGQPAGLGVRGQRKGVAALRRSRRTTPRPRAPRMSPTVGSRCPTPPASGTTSRRPAW